MAEVPELPAPFLMRLPQEIHLAVISHLPYPDALSLKHSNRHFYHIVHTGVELKIQWLIARRKLHLECPHSGQCVLKTDQEFCRGSVRLLMARRRQHGECDVRDGGRGCLVLGTKVCQWRRDRRLVVRIGKWCQTNVTMLVGLLGILLSVLCMLKTD